MIVETHDILLSFIRWIVGLSIGCILGLLLALLGSFRYANGILRVFIDFLRAIPIIGLVPVIQMNFGINEYCKIGLIAWAVLFPVWITVSNAITQDMQNSSLLLQAANIRGWSYFKLFLLPKILGGFLKAVEIAIGIGWLAVVAAEWIGTFTQGFWNGGLGYKLLLGNEINNWDMVHYNLLVFGLLGLFTAYLWRLLMLLIFKQSQTFNPLLKEFISS